MTSEIYLFRMGKKLKDGKDSYVSYTKAGKVIIGTNCTKTGFYRLVETKEREYSILAKVEPVYYDYYNGMTYKDLKKLLTIRGYNIAFEMPFKYNSSREFRLVVYNRTLNLVIIADTIEGGTKFNSIRCYSYHRSKQLDNWVHKNLLVFDSDTVTCFDITGSSYHFQTPLQEVEKLCTRGDIGKIAYHDMPQGFTYADSFNMNTNVNMYRDKFYSLCPSGLKEWFEEK